MHYKIVAVGYSRCDSAEPHPATDVSKYTTKINVGKIELPAVAAAGIYCPFRSATLLLKKMPFFKKECPQLFESHAPL